MSLGHIYDTNLYSGDECNLINIKVGTIDAKSTVVTALNLPRGTKAAPPVTFSTDTTTGYYSAAANSLDFTISGANILSLNTGTNLHLGNLTDPLNISSGVNNYVIGNTSGYSLTTGQNNCIFGTNCMPTASASQYNIAIGNGALNLSASATGCVAIGRNTLSKTNGSYAVAIGDNALANTTQTGNNSNVAVGGNSLTAATTAQNNTCIGFNTGAGTLSGGANCYMGANAARYNTGSNNIAIGSSALGATTAAASQTIAIGTQSLLSYTGTSPNIAIGHSAGSQISTGVNNVILGSSAAAGLTTGARNILIGDSSSAGISTTSDNVGVGYQTFNTSSTNCQLNTAVGNYALNKSNASGNTAVGYQAGFSVTNSNGFTGVGYLAGQSVAGAGGVTCVGYGAGAFTTTGADSCYMGYQVAWAQNNTGGNNVGIGSQAMYTVTSATNNVCIGYRSALALNTGAENVFIGSSAGATVTSGSQNVLIGKSAAPSSITGIGQNVIGAFITGNGNNTTTISNMTPNQGFFSNALRNANKTSYVLYDSVSGELTYDASVPSSLRFKENLRPTGLPDLVSALDVYRFDYNDKADPQYRGKPFIGMVAEEVEQFLPEACKYVKGSDGVDELYTIDYSLLVIPLWSSLKAALKRIDVLEEKVSLLASS